MHTHLIYTCVSKFSSLAVKISALIVEMLDFYCQFLVKISLLYSLSRVLLFSFMFHRLSFSQFNFLSFYVRTVLFWFSHDFSCLFFASPP